MTMSLPRALRSFSRTRKRGPRKAKNPNKWSLKRMAKKRLRKKKNMRRVSLFLASIFVEEESTKEETKESKQSQSTGEKVKGFFFEPEGGNPRPEGWMAALLAASALYYIINHKKPMKEIIYMDFLNNYLIQNKVKEIKITKDRSSEVFNHRAEIEMTDGDKFYMVLGS